MNASSTSLIPTFNGTLDGYEQPLVNAYDLHEFLGVQTPLHIWIKRRINDHKFIENLDFLNLNKIVQVRNAFSTREVEQVEHHLTVDMAKELAMLENNERGRQARRYFIGIEKQSRAQFVQAMQLREALLKSNELWGTIMRYKTLGLNHVEIGRLLQTSATHVRTQVRQLEELGYLTPPPNLAQLQAAQRKGTTAKIAINPSAEV